MNCNRKRCVYHTYTIVNFIYSNILLTRKINSTKTVSHYFSGRINIPHTVNSAIIWARRIINRSIHEPVRFGCSVINYNYVTLCTTLLRGTTDGYHRCYNYINIIQVHTKISMPRKTNLELFHAPSKIIVRARVRLNFSCLVCVCVCVRARVGTRCVRVS